MLCFGAVWGVNFWILASFQHDLSCKFVRLPSWIEEAETADDCVWNWICCVSFMDGFECWDYSCLQYIFCSVQFYKGFNCMLCEFCCTAGFMQTGIVRRRKWGLGLCCDSEWFGNFTPGLYYNNWYILVAFPVLRQTLQVTQDDSISTCHKKIVLWFCSLYFCFSGIMLCFLWKPDTSCIMLHLYQVIELLVYTVFTHCTFFFFVP